MPVKKKKKAKRTKWDGRCPAKKHGLDFRGQTCDLCERAKALKVDPPKIEPWLQTFSGLAVEPGRPGSVGAFARFCDIAHALSHLTRFAGHASRFYSVAEHSVLVSRVVDELLASVSAYSMVKALALLHDASEAYLGDVPAPVKALPQMAAYRKLESEVQAEIELKFVGRFYSNDPIMTICGRMRRDEIVRAADIIVLTYEAERLMLVPPKPWGVLPIRPWRDFACLIRHAPGLSPREAKRLFLERAREVALSPYL